MAFVNGFDTLEVRKLSGRKWRVLKNIKFVHNINGKIVCVEVPAGFVTDFASVPRPFWVFTPPDGKYTMAAVVHDYLCSHPKIMKRKAADELFMEIAEKSGVGRATAYIMFASIRIYRGFLEKLFA